jgi:hypothetical protein
MIPQEKKDDEKSRIRARVLRIGKMIAGIPLLEDEELQDGDETIAKRVKGKVDKARARGYSTHDTARFAQRAVVSEVRRYEHAQLAAERYGGEVGTGAEHGGA